MKKVLIITYYWPPSGGAGVQRWVKLTKYLANLNVEIHVLTVNEKKASYVQIDNSLNYEINKKIKTYKTDSFEPIKIYGKIVGKENIPTAGFSNVNNKSFKQRAINAIRSNFFIPDPRRGWNKYAYKKACEIIKENDIKTVITTSPPHSTQLIGLKLKKTFNLKWIADLRDPWTDIYYYSILNHSFISKNIDRWYEKKVIEQSDYLVTVSDSLKSLFLKKSEVVDVNKIIVLPNGFDPKDYTNSEVRDNDIFTISYTGTMSEQYFPDIFFEAIAEIINENKIDMKFRIVGSISTSILKKIKELNLLENFEFIQTVPHSEIIKYQQNTHLLLLVIPKVENSKGILTGKLFEYLATGNKILCIGPKEGDASKIINNCNAGIVFDRNQKDKIKKYILNHYIEYSKGKLKNIIHKNVNEYNRQEQAKSLLRIL